MPFFDRAARGGVIASRIYHQDAVAVLIMLRILAGEKVFGLTLTEPDGVVLHCEGRDDLELVTPERRCLISVKTQSVKLSLVIEEYARLSKRRVRTAMTRAGAAGCITRSPTARRTWP
jgi:hypothetical protein